MRTKTSAFAVALVVCTVFNLLGQRASAQTWTLPQGVSVKDSGPRTYRFTVVYSTANTKGELLRRQRLTGGVHARVAGRRSHLEERNADGRGRRDGSIRSGTEARLHGGVPLRE